MEGTQEQKEPERDDLPKEEEPQTTGGVSFVVPPPEPSQKKDTINPSREEIRDTLARSGVSSESRKKPRKEKTSLRRLRTYKDDVAEILRKTKGSKVSIKVSEELKTERKRQADREAEQLKEVGEKRKEYLKEKEKNLKKRERIQYLQERAKYLDSEENIKKELEQTRLSNKEKEHLLKEQIQLKSVREEKEGLEKRKQQQLKEAEERRRQYLREKEGLEEEKVEIQKNQEKGAENIFKDQIKQEKIRIRKEREQIAKAQREQVEKKVEQTPVVLEKEPKKGGVVLFFLSILFLVLGGLTLYGVYFFFFTEEIKPPILDIDTLVFTEENIGIDIDSLPSEDFVKELGETVRALSLPLGEMSNIRLTRNVLVDDVVTIETTPFFMFFENLAPNAPSALARSFSEEFMFGIHSLEKNEPFLILKPTFYESSFARMLEWESSMPKDLSPLFMAEISDEEILFEDVIVENKDTRIFYDAVGKITLIYSFLDRETLVITTNKVTFLEIFKRMTSKRVSR